MRELSSADRPSRTCASHSGTAALPASSERVIESDIMDLSDRKRKAIALAAASVAHFASSLTAASNKAAASVISTVVADEDIINRNMPHKRSGRYKRDSALHNPKDSFWKRVDAGDDAEFFNFVSLPRHSFNDLVGLCEADILSMPIRPINGDTEYGTPRPCDLRRRVFSPRDILAMALRFLLSTAEEKDLHVHFGALESTFSDCIWLGMKVLVKNMADDPRSRVYWDRSLENMMHCAERTSDFDLVPNIVALVDGMKVRTKNDPDPIAQNRDFTLWKEDTFRDCVFITDPYGRIVDAAVNYPGNFHDSKKALWSHMYEHILALPAPYRVASDSAFVASGDFKDKVIKTKWKKTKEDCKKGRKEKVASQLTHLRQPAEWSNNSITGVYRRLQCELPTDNARRAYILWSCIFLTNWRTNTSDRNQIATYFNYLDECRKDQASYKKEVADTVGELS